MVDFDSEAGVAREVKLVKASMGEHVDSQLM
jgi:hypothetical protein